MNSIQMISRNIETRRLKLQMGLDPAAKINAQAVRGMWRQLNGGRLREEIAREYAETGAGALPAEPGVFDG